MPGRWQQLLQHDWVGGCLVGDDLHRGDLGRAERPLEEPAGRGASRRGETNTSMTWPNWSIARETERKGAGELHLGLVDLPAITDGIATRPGSLGQPRCEPLDPPGAGEVVDLQAAFGQQLLQVAVRQRQAQLPAHRQHDHLGAASRSRRTQTVRQRRSGDGEFSWRQSACSRLDHSSCNSACTAGGVFELPLGSPLRYLVKELGGGPPDGRAIKAIFPGASNTVIVPAQLDVPLDFDSMR
jgi:hypothetical protein